MNRSTSLSAVSALLALSALPAAAVDGQLDNSFDTDGRATLGFNFGGSNIDEANAVAQLPDGRIVLAGYITRATPGDTDFGIVGLESNGAPDTDFAGDAKQVVAYDIGPNNDGDRAHAVATMDDGSIVLCGTATYDVDASFEKRLVLSRLLPTGDLDLPYGPDNNGKVRLNPFNRPESNNPDCRSLVVHQDGRVVVPFVTGGYLETGLVRLDANGELDGTFGGSGISELPDCSTGATECRLAEVLLLPDGKYMAIGTKSVEVSMGVFDIRLFFARYTSGGFLDDTFSGDGQAILNHPTGSVTIESVMDAALDPHGRVVVLENVTPGDDFYVVRIDANGAADTNFGTAGWSQIELRDPPATTQTVNSLIIQGDGKLMLSGYYHQVSFNYDCAAMRLNASATAVDATFGVAGRQAINFDLSKAATDFCYESDAADGRLLLAASAVADSADFGAARLTNAYIFVDGFESGTDYFWSSSDL